MENKLLHNVLCTVRDDKAARLDYVGICCCVRYTLLDLFVTNRERSAALNLMEQLIAEWPERFINPDDAEETRDYPVGGAEQYNMETLAESLWDNQKRWDLLNWLIEQTGGEY